MEGRESSRAISAKLLLFSPFGVFLVFHLSETYLMFLESDFLNLRQREIFSSAVFTLLYPIRRWTGELFSSASRFVRLQSSMASFMAVTVRMKRSGAALRPGLDAPNMLKACGMLNRWFKKYEEFTYAQYNNKKEIKICNIMELIP
jgi:hypothetical protein